MASMIDWFMDGNSKKKGAVNSDINYILGGSSSKKKKQKMK
jgi:hypothetical protein